MKKLRLLLFEKCNRTCKGCCNQYWDLGSLPRAKRFHQYNEVLLTGGEPMLDPLLIINTAKKISSYSNAKIFLYTAKIDDWQAVLSVLHYIDGMSVTLHKQSDVRRFQHLNDVLVRSKIKKSLKINIFGNVRIGFNVDLWRIKHKKWIDHQHLPKNEVFKRL